jgi:hypothetical protein
MNDINRRQFINGVAKSCLGVSAIIGADDLLGANLPAHVPSARSVIFLYMAGGMTHLDTLDPKPENKEVMGETTAIDTSADGIQLGHWLPKTAHMLRLTIYFIPAINVEVQSYTQLWEHG